jgi:Tol biopolymer transport system component
VRGGFKDELMSKEYVARGNGFDIHFTWFGDYLLARVEGLHDNLEITVAYWKMVFDECAKWGAKRVLVLENLIEAGENLDTQETFERLLAIVVDKDLRIAFVDRNETNWAFQEHVTLLAREQGIVVRLFTQQRDAVTWLRHGID